MQAKQRRASWRRRGQLAIEWIFLATLLGIGVIGGLGAVRNALLAELQDIASAVIAFRFFP